MKVNILVWLIILTACVLFIVFYIEKENTALDPLNEEIKENGELPEELHPIVEEKKNQLVEQAEEQGIPIIITEGFRTVARQDELYQQGRSEDGDIVTYAEGGESYHNYGLAIDFALQNENGRAVWDMSYDGNGNGESDWMEIVDIAKELGFEWGGDWARFKDYPHLQMDFGLSIYELKRGKRPEDPVSD
ncbi:M15 family metallopeptidase [Virgibacillus senegalensis]|uniref:M15 family metallopeptidase n=1 Tax=Virgibacillus senegalensis TaxID=1499679 RepID=UPI00069EE0D0|nr:M15 family metallopeptidase [Virgibacillus senegalensis]